MSNKIDKAVIYVICNSFSVIDSEKFKQNLNDFNRYKHIKVTLTRNKELRCEFTGKVLKNANTLELIGSDNIYLVSETIEDTTGVRIELDVLLSSRLTQVDVTEDLYFEKEKLSDYISTFREMANKSTYKSLINSFRNDLGFENSILIRSSCKTVKDSLTVYKKFDEMYSKRKKDNGYYNSFSAEFLEECKKILRFERRIIGKRQISRALHLPARADVNLNAVFNSEHNLVKEKIFELVGKI